MPRAVEILKHGTDCRHAVPRRISSRFGLKIFNFFRGRRIFRSKSREIAPKSMPIGGAQPCHEPQRSPSTVPSVGMLRHVRLHAICGESRTENFEFFRGRKILRPKSREIAPKSLSIGDAQSCHEPQRYPSTVPSGQRRHTMARRISPRSQPIWTENFEIFSRRKIFSSKIARDRAEIPVDW